MHRMRMVFENGNWNFNLQPQPDHIMFREYNDPESYDFIAIFYSHMDNPLAIWDKQINGSGRISRAVDKDRISSLQLIQNFFPTHTYITAPREPFSSLGIQLEWITFVMMSIRKSVVVTIQIKDDTDLRRKFVLRNDYRSIPSTATVAYGHLNFESTLEWNQLQFNLAKATFSTFGTNYIETTRVQISPSCRIRLIYFSAQPMEIEEAMVPLRKSLDVIQKDIDADKYGARRKSYLLVPSYDAAFVPTLAHHNERKEMAARVAIYSQPREKPRTAEVPSSARVIIHPAPNRAITASASVGSEPGTRRVDKRPSENSRPLASFR